jgi:hypothetical protein
MKTMLNAFDDYNDKMNKLANAHEAESYFLNKTAKHLRELSDSLNVTSESLNKAINNRKEINAQLN